MALDMRICERDAAVAELEAAACIAVKRQVQVRLVRLPGLSL